MQPTFFTRTDEAWNEMLLLCKNARTSIDLEQYIFENDEIGSEFLKILIEKAKSGVAVRMILDGIGSYYFYASPIPEELSRVGVGIDIRFFNIVKPWRLHNFFSYFFRDHRKILVVDNEYAILGGVGIRADMRDWRDTSVLLTGPVVREIKKAFNEMWTLAINKNILERFQKIQRQAPHNHFLTNAPYPRQRLLYRACVKQFALAKKSVLITTPYFVPNLRMINALKRLARRGVEVKILVPYRNDSSLVYRATHSFFTELLMEGVRIFEYKGEFLHAKTILVDDSWALHGSFNFDNLSFFYNHEAAIVTDEIFYVKTLKEHFEKDLEKSKEVILKEWKKRPLLWKLREFLVTAIRRFL
jgi:cardiolipin synthase